MMNAFRMQRLDVVIEPEPGNLHEVEGILNPAATRGPDGELYLFPRIVGAGNFSRIGIAKVLFDDAGDPSGIERLGIALEPEMPYELRPNGGGGCEDPRVTYVEPLKSYIMTYTAFSPEGPRIAMAISNDLLSWHRLGLAEFRSYEGMKFSGLDNKDASFFPVNIPSPTHHPELAMLHRPLFPTELSERTIAREAVRKRDLHEESIWISYSPTIRAESGPQHMRQFTSLHRLAAPISPWEALKIGGGTPPILTKHGWLVVYHGVDETLQLKSQTEQLNYSAGVMILAEDHPQVLLYRSPKPLLNPEPSKLQRGTPANVVFPSGIDRRDDLGQPDRFDVYFGMDDFRIGVARLDIPDVMPATGIAHAPSRL
jgi:predicted GH43/DUF377 family glycosyl hydrolase